MRNKNILKSTYFHIVAVVLVFLIIGGLLFAEQIGYKAEPNTTGNNLLEEDEWLEAFNVDAGKTAHNAPRCLVLYDALDSSSERLSNNIMYTLSSINVDVTKKEIAVNALGDSDEEADAFDETQNMRIDESVKLIRTETASEIDFAEYDDIVLCVSSISAIEIDAVSLLQWVENGGHLMFPCGFDENIDLALWGKLIGIAGENTISVAYADSLQFDTNIMAGVEGKEFSDDVISGEVMDVTLADDCLIHISTSDENTIPLLWEHRVENGMAIVCNSDLMASKSDRGIIVSSYCRFYPIYAYPVINACVYCIDDCPSPIPAGYDKNILSQYGITINDYYTNVWMPAMQKLAAEYDIKYSTFSIQTYEDNVDGPFNNVDNRKMASYYAGLILNMGGEVGIHGYNHQPLVLDGYQFDEENSGYTCWNNYLAMLNSIKAVIRYTESLSDELYVQAYVAPSNIISYEALQEMMSQIESIRVYAGVYVGTQDQFVQEFEVLDNGIAFCPRLTADMQMEDSEWWVQINELNYHYVESNFIHPDDILDEDRSDGGDFKQMLDGYTKMVQWNQRMGLRNTTISQCGAAVQRYGNLNYTQDIEANKMNITVNGLVDTAYMMIRTNGKRIVSVTGGTIQSLNDDIYILTIESKNVTLQTVNKR